MNTVIAGDYKGKWLRMLVNNTACIELGYGKTLRINKDTVQRYEVSDQNTKTGFSVGKAVVGTALFGGIGAVAGAGGKTKSTYQVVIYFRDGKQSLLEVDEKFYKAITVELFGVEDYQPAPPQPPKPKKHIALRVVIFFVCAIVCLIIVQAFTPVVDGELQLNAIGYLFVLGVPTLAAVFLPKFIFRGKQ